MKHPAHIAAKQRRQQWLTGYQMVIAEVIGSCGDGGTAHPLGGLTLHPRVRD